MLARAENVAIEDPPENAIFRNNKARRIFQKMPILSDLSRRFHMLTTDAKPDPPRVQIKEPRHDLRPPSDEKSKAKSRPTTPTKEHSGVSLERQKSLPNNAIPNYFSKEEDFGERPSESKEYRKPRTKTKAKQSRYTQGTNVVNYNIINSNGVKIGSRTSYICNVNQYPSSNPTASETYNVSNSKPKRTMPENVESLSTCTDEITLDDMFIVKTHIGHGWKDIARRLSYSDGQIDQFEENHKNKGLDEVIYQLLLDWKQANTKDAQIGILVFTLWSCQEYDCAERLAAARKSPS